MQARVQYMLLRGWRRVVVVVVVVMLGLRREVRSLEGMAEDRGVWWVVWR